MCSFPFLSGLVDLLAHGSGGELTCFVNGLPTSQYLAWLLWGGVSGFSFPKPAALPASAHPTLTTMVFLTTPYEEVRVLIPIVQMEKSRLGDYVHVHKQVRNSRDSNPVESDSQASALAPSIPA